MSRVKNLETRLTSVQSELELSTFLNKGVLQTNSELKLRIVELERENDVLRTAESRLAQTEDELEVCERRLKEREEELLEEVEREREEREKAEDERDAWRGRVERLREWYEGGRGLLVGVDREVKAGGSVSPLSSCTTGRMVIDRNHQSSHQMNEAKSEG